MNFKIEKNIISDKYFFYLNGPPILAKEGTSCTHSGGEVDEFNLSEDKHTVDDKYIESSDPIKPPSFIFNQLSQFQKENFKWLRYDCKIKKMHKYEELRITLKARFSSKTLYDVSIETIHYGNLKKKTVWFK